jgi:hypothetical protein
MKVAEKQCCKLKTGEVGFPPSLEHTKGRKTKYTKVYGV